MRATGLLGGLLVLASGSTACRDLGVPEFRPGLVSGFVVATDVASRPRRVEGATVSVVGTALATTTTSEGAFSLGPIDNASGALLLVADLDGDGDADLARALDFAAWGIGPNRVAALGEVALRTTAVLSGRATLRGAGSSAGIEVFVPGTAFSTITTPSGSYVLSGLPEGTVSVGYAAAGHQARRLEGLVLRAAEELTLAPLTLEPAPPTLSTVRGAFVLDPAGDLTSIRASAWCAGGLVTALLVDGSGRFAGTVPAGRCSVVASAPGYSDALLPNVLAPAEAELDVGTVRLTAGSGRVDAGAPEGRGAGGTDGGPHDDAGQRGDAGASLGDGGRPAGCGDSVVSGLERCDDGNTEGGDGCSPDCKLEWQPVRGTNCLEPSPITLVPIDATHLGAQLAYDGGPTGAFFSICGGGAHHVAASFSLPWTATVSLTSFGTASVSTRSPTCEREVTCGTGVTRVFQKGEYILLIETGDQTATVTLTATPQPAGPYCGDGTLSAGEECDDGPQVSLACSETCILRPQDSNVTCGKARALAIARANDVGRAFFVGPSFHDETGVDPQLRPSCIDAGMTGVVAVAGATDVLFSADTPFYDLALAAFTGSCAAPQELGCVNATTTGAEALNLTGLDGGVIYLVLAADRPVIGRLDGVIETRP